MINKIGLLTIIATLSSSVLSQSIDYPDSFNEPMQLFPEAMGDFHYSSCNGFCRHNYI